MLIDTHCHLDFPVLADQLDRVLAHARYHAVQRFIIPGVTADRFDTLVKLAGQYDLGFALGLHPCFLAQHTDQSLTLLAHALDVHTPLAVGEIGLDFYHGTDTAAQQIALLKCQLQLAQAHQLPVILHVRKAHDHVLKALRETQFTHGGVVHAFSGSMAQAERYLARGFKLGVGGMISYDRAQRVKKLFAHLPLTALVLETDAPDMPLQGMRAGTNEPASVANIAQVLAALQQCSVEHVAHQTTTNALALFPTLL